MNTPYERAKLLRCTEETRNDEARRRRRCVDAWMGGFLQLQAQELTERLLLSLGQKESRRRAAVVAEEERERARAACAVDQCAVLSALAVHEREGRLAVGATESESRLRLRVHMQLSHDYVHLIHKEGCGRSTVEFNEGAARDAVRRSMANTRERMQTNEMQQMDYWRHCEELRSGVVRECLAQYDRLAALKDAHAHWIANLMQRRVTLAEGALRSAEELQRAEAAVRRGMQEEMSEGVELLTERRRIFARSCQNLARTEAAARQGILEEMTSSYHSLFLDLVSEAEEVAEAERQKARRREVEAQSALSHLQGILREEADEFAAILSHELREREQRRGWMEAKAAARTDFVLHAMASKAHLAAEEEDARRQLSRGLQQSEMAVQEHMAQRERYCRNLWTAAVAEKEDIHKDEHDGRFHLLSLMAEREESVRRWCEHRARAATGFTAMETKARGQLVGAEATAWDALVTSFVRGAEAVERRERQCRDAASSLQRACDWGRGAVEAEESECFAALLAFQTQERRRALAAEHHRVRMAFQLREGQRRAWLMQEEGGERDGLRASMAVAQQYLCEEAEQRFRVRAAELLAAERGARAVIVRAVEGDYQRLYSQERKEQLQAVVAEEQRIAAEIRAREQCLEEDARLYAAAEPKEVLLFADDAHEGAARQRQGDPHPRGPDDVAGALKLQLVLQTLGVSLHEATKGGLDGGAVGYLVAIVDGIHHRRAEAQDHLGALEKDAEDAAHRAAQLEALYMSEKEKRDANAARLERAGEDQGRRLQSDRAERQRGAHQIETDRRRLEEAVSQLEGKKAELESLRKSINRQFGRA